MAFANVDQANGNENGFEAVSVKQVYMQEVETMT
jgi:hypothetical protein